jgi:hypothetical protein
MRVVENYSAEDEQVSNKLSYEKRCGPALKPTVTMTSKRKKELDYNKQRRNCYGENPAASRRGVRRRKGFLARAGRRQTTQQLGQIHDTNSELDDATELEIRHTPVQGWKKVPDKPLGQLVLELLSWDIENAILRHSTAAPTLIPDLVQQVSKLGWPVRAVEDFARSVTAINDTAGRSGKLALSLNDTRAVWKIVRAILQRHGIEPLARRRRKKEPSRAEGSESDPRE